MLTYNIYTIKFSEIQTDYQTPAKKPDLILITKKKTTRPVVYFAVPADHRVEMKEHKKSGSLDRSEKAASNAGTFCSWRQRTVLKAMETIQADQKKNRDNPDHSNVEIS